jgi:hypothetical protein
VVTQAREILFVQGQLPFASFLQGVEDMRVEIIDQNRK